MAEAPAEYETLTPDDAVDIYEELLPAQNHSYVLGLKLKLEPHVVEAIHSRDMAPGEYLLQVIMEFTRQTEPRPTWRVIVEVLRSPAVRLAALAKEVETAHPPRPPSSRDVVPETTTATESAATGTTAAAAAAAAADDDDDEVKSKPSSQPTTVSAQNSTIQSSQQTSAEPDIGTHEQLIRWIQELKQKETELVQARDKAKQQLREKEAEQTRAEETVRRDQQQIQEMRQKETELVQARDKAEQQLREKDGQLRSSERETQTVRQQLTRMIRELAEAQQQLREKEEQLRSSETSSMAFQPSMAFQQKDPETHRSKTQPVLPVQSEVPASGSVEAVEAEITGLSQRFNSIKELTIQALEECCFAVMRVVHCLLTIACSRQEHTVFLMENRKALRQCNDHLELFESLDFYWNYLAPDLLDHLITELAKEPFHFHPITAEMALYKKDLREFRKRTTLELFCLAVAQPLEEDPPPEFRKMVVKFDWPPTRTLEDVEMFRRQCAPSYDLRTCAMMLNSIGTR